MVTVIGGVIVLTVDDPEVIVILMALPRVANTRPSDVSAAAGLAERSAALFIAVADTISVPVIKTPSASYS